MDRRKLLGLALTSAFGLSSWAVSVIAGQWAWLPYVVLPISAVVALTICAQLYFDHVRDSRRVMLPGFGVHMAIRIGDLPDVRRQYVFDIGDPGEPGASFYLSASRRFVFSVRDKNGEPYNIEVPAGWLGFPIADYAYFALEAGTDGRETTMRAMVNGRIIAERKLPFAISFGPPVGDRMTLGANRKRSENGAFALGKLLLYNGTLTSTQAKYLAKEMAKRTGIHHNG